MWQKIDTDSAKIDALLSRGVEDALVKKHLRQALASGRQLRVKLGIDPTSKSIHLGRAIPLWKLRDFQELGHTVVFIVGDFTAQVGDPSDKLEKRPMLSEGEIKENLKNYKAIAGKILNMKKVEFFYNSRWLSKLSFKETCALAETFSVQQMISRRNFAERLEKGQEVSLREFLYPLMQGYDSVQVRADVELGGTDQLFNLKAGRIVQKHYGQAEQDILMTAMLEGTDGRKMSSSWGNVINVTDTPSDMYGKIMAVRDELIIKYFTLCTRVPLAEIDSLQKQLAGGTNPKEVKMRLAREIVTLYNGKAAADSAEKDFQETFSGGGIPENIPTLKAEPEKLLADVLVEQKILPSKAQWRRLVDEGAVFNMESKEKTSDPFVKAVAGVYRLGKKTFVRLT